MQNNKKSTNTEYIEPGKLYQDRLETNLDFLYLKSNARNVNITILLVFLLTIGGLWLKYFYFTGEPTRLKENPVLLIIIFLWLGLSQIYTWNYYFYIKRREHLCIKELGLLPGINTFNDQKTTMKYIRNKYNILCGFLTPIIPLLVYFIGFMGIWFSFFQVAIYLNASLIIYFQLTMMYSLFYNGFFGLIGVIGLVIGIHYIMYTNKPDKIATERYVIGTDPIFYSSRDNRVPTKFIYMLVSSISILVLLQAGFNLWSKDQSATKNFGFYGCPSSCSLYLEGYEYAEKKDEENIAGVISLELCNSNSTSFKNGCTYYILSRTSTVTMITFLPALIITAILTGGGLN